MNSNSKLQWPSSITASKDMSYDSIQLLYIKSKPEVFADNIGLSVACSKHDLSPDDSQGCIHKLEVTTTPTPSDLKITHEVLPGQGNCSQIITVNEKLLVAGFESGAIIPIKNFGPKKTFNCDVRGRLTHHSSPIYCLASDTIGEQLASGSVDGELALYSVRKEDIYFLSRSRLSDSPVTGLAYVKPSRRTYPRPEDDQVLTDQYMIVYATRNGRIGLVDTRCRLGEDIDVSPFHNSKPKESFTTLCSLSTIPNVVYLGTAMGQLKSIDLRIRHKLLNVSNNTDSGAISKIKEVVIEDKYHQETTYLAYTSHSREIKIIDANTLLEDSSWICERFPEDIQLDLCQVGEKIFTCGKNTSIGCWAYKGSGNRENQHM